MSRKEETLSSYSLFYSFPPRTVIDNNFLFLFSKVYGGRWRCGVCENILSVRDLVHCGLFQAMLDEYRGSVSGSRDKVSV